MTIARDARSALVAAWLLCAACQSSPPAVDPTSGSEEGGPTWHFEGNESFDDKELDRVLGDTLVSLGGGELDRARADDLAFGLELFYRNAGFLSVEVEYDVEGEPPRASATFLIQEGPLVILEGFDFAGNEKFSAVELTAFFKVDHPRWFREGQRLYVERNLDAGREAIEAAYLDAGYLDVRVEIERQPGEDPGLARATVRVQEGKQYRLTGVEISCPSDLPSLAEQSEMIARESIDQPYRPRLGYEIRARLLDLFANHGYPDVKVDVSRSLEPETASVELLIDIRPGPLVQISEVVFRGAPDANESFLLSRVKVETGGPYDGSLVEESVRRLYATGLYREVQSRIEGSGEERLLVFELKEAPTRELFVEPGYGSYELFRLRLGARERNLWGSGRQLRAETSLAVLAQDARIVLSDPWFLGSEYIADLTVEYTRREEPSFTQKGPGVGFTLTRHITHRLSRSIGYQLRQSSSANVDVSEEVDSSDVLLSSLRVSQRYDSRDNFFVPRKGAFVEASLEYGPKFLGSELEFVRSTLNSSIYHALSERDTLALAFRTGVIVPVGDDHAIPIQERFFNGGENTVRSFKESKLGPHDDDGDPLGGETFSTLNLELRHALTPKWEAAAFVDLGNVRPDASDYLGFGGIKAGVGTGIRYLLPVGPIRVDVGVNPDPGDDDDDVVVQVALGLAF